MNDLQTALGNFYGPYTQELDTFFRELRKSGIVGLMAEEAALGRHKPASRTPFIFLYRELTPDVPDSAGELFDAVYTCFQASLKAQIRDQSLAFLIHASNRQLNDRLRHISELFSEHLYPSEILSPDIHADQLREITRGLQSMYKNIHVETNRGARMVDINRIYISSKLRYKTIPAVLETEMQFQSRFAVQRGTPAISLIEYNNFRRGFKRIVILGDAGGGKSTLCQYL